MTDAAPATSAMIVIANPERWTNLRAVELGEPLPGHLIAVVSGTMRAAEAEWLNGRYERQLHPRTVAIVADTVDEHIVTLTCERDWAKREADDAKADLHKAREQAAEAEKKLRMVEAELGAAHRLNKKQGEEAGDATARLRKLEDDLGKVRAVFGSKAYDEAIGKAG